MCSIQLPELFSNMSEEEKQGAYILARYQYKIGDTVLTDDEYDILERYIIEKEYLAEYTSRNWMDDPIPFALLDYYENKLEQLENREELEDLANNTTPSIKAVYDEAILFSFYKEFKNRSFIISDKIDGVSAKIKIQDGELKAACSKGTIDSLLDFKQGMTKYFKLNKIFPDGVYDGELCISDSNREKLKEKYKNKKFKTPRAAILSLIRCPQDFKDEDFEYLQLFVFNSAYSDTYRISERFSELKENGIAVPNYLRIEPNSLAISSLEEFRESINPILKSFYENQINYECDGLVMELDEPTDLEYKLENQYRESQRAIKFSHWGGVDAIGVIERIEVEQESSQCSVVAIIEPLKLTDKTTATRVNLHNPSVVMRDDLEKGAKIKFTRISGVYNNYVGRVRE